MTHFNQIIEDPTTYAYRIASKEMKHFKEATETKPEASERHLQKSHTQSDSLPPSSNCLENKKEQ